MFKTHYSTIILALIIANFAGCKNNFPMFWKKSTTTAPPETQETVERLTRNYTTLPSSEEVNAELDLALSPPTLPNSECPVVPEQEEERAPAQVQELEIIPKEQWGARPLQKDGSFKCMDYRSMASQLGLDSSVSDEELLASVYQNGRIVIHHTATNGSIQNIQADHMDGRSLQDIAYHFFISRDGKIYEGRSLTLMGAHAGSLNNDHYSCMGKMKSAHINRDYDFKSIGIVLSGNLELRAPDDAQYQALKSLVSHLAEKYKISLIGGHEHYREDGTDCPGAKLVSRLNNDPDIQLEAPVDKSENFFKPDFVCESESVSCR